MGYSAGLLPTAFTVKVLKGLFFVHLNAVYHHAGSLEKCVWTSSMSLNSAIWLPLQYRHYKLRTAAHRLANARAPADTPAAVLRMLPLLPNLTKEQVVPNAW